MAAHNQTAESQDVSLNKWAHSVSNSNLHDLEPNVWIAGLIAHSAHFSSASVCLDNS